MTEGSSAQRLRWPFPIRVMLARPRMLISMLSGVAVVLLLPLLTPDLHGVTRYLVGWDFGAGLYLILAFWMFANC